MTEQWVTIDKNTDLKPGDVVRIYFAVTGMTWLTATQLAAIDSELAKDKRFTILSYSMPDKNNEIFFKIRVNEQADEPLAKQYSSGALLPAVIIAAIIAAGGVITSCFVWLTVREITKQIKTEAEAAMAGTPIKSGSVTSAIKAVGTSGLMLAAAAIIVILVWSKSK